VEVVGCGGNMDGHMEGASSALSRFDQACSILVEAGRVMD
jgi:hypothetical protein